MTESATTPQTIRIVVPGEARPYRERAHKFRRRRPGNRGQPEAAIKMRDALERTCRSPQGEPVAFAILRQVVNYLEEESPA